jgi:hypothetical protein
MNPKDMEKYSSAYTLSDMEIFVFPELMYSLVLANLMSPILWRWREEETFKKLAGKSPYRKLLRLRQYIMDEYDFNLDLETWGLTDKATETRRFEPFLSAKDIAASNALFGYEGDQYYYDVDIRKHFGLDKYTTDTIPYWKTETVEAMNAFPLRLNYTKKAGECVSLSTLYAAAAFIVCGVPLDDLFMVLTPLHSQNFIDLDEGVITNNRRLVTKAMWFNGTEISNKAQRALRHEQVTMVAHSTGVIHCLYNQATISRQAYDRLSRRLASYLKADLNLLNFASFLRTRNEYQRYFQVCRDCHGHAQYVKAEVLYHYEHGSKYRVGDETFEKLLAEVHSEEYAFEPIPNRLRCDEICSMIAARHWDLTRTEDRNALGQALSPVIPDVEAFIRDLMDFLEVKPRLPSPEKTYVHVDPIVLTADMDRPQVIETLEQHRSSNAIVDLAFYAYRDMSSCDWRPFVKAAVERSPVSLAMVRDLPMDQVNAWLQVMPGESIYDSQRLAQPDEVSNFRTGDGVEKAFVLASILRRRKADQEVKVIVDGDQVVVQAEEEYSFSSSKGLHQEVMIEASGEIHAS